jgi:hypothetical protein
MWPSYALVLRDRITTGWFSDGRDASFDMSAGDGDYIRKIEELLRASMQLADYDSRIELYQEAIRLADLHADIEVGYRLRRELIDLASHGLKYDVYGVTFAWCFAQAQREPSRFRPQDLLYHYQHVIGKLVNFPQFRRQDYEGLFQDVVKHLRANGYSPRTVMIERRSVALDFGDLEMAEAADIEWRKYPRDALCAGLGFEAGRQIEYDRTFRSWVLPASSSAASACFTQCCRPRLSSPT